MSTHVLKRLDIKLTKKQAEQLNDAYAPHVGAFVMVEPGTKHSIPQNVLKVWILKRTFGEKINRFIKKQLKAMK